MRQLFSLIFPALFSATSRAFRANFACIVILYYKLKEISSTAGIFFRFLSKILLVFSFWTSEFTFFAKIRLTENGKTFILENIFNDFLQNYA